jgi:LacI family transcriptional regulator
MMALACINVLMEAGIKIPDQVKVVGYDNVSVTRFTSPQITTITQDTRQMAIAAGRTILRMIQKKEISEKRTIIPVRLEVRGTT